MSSVGSCNTLRRADLSAQVQFTRSAYWNALDVALNVLTALLAGLAGVSSLAHVAGQTTAGFLALGAAALAAVNTALTADKRSSTASAAGNAYIDIRDAFRQVRRLDLSSKPIEQTRSEIRELSNRLHSINKEAPITGRWAWHSALRRQRRRRSE